MAINGLDVASLTRVSNHKIGADLGEVPPQNACFCRIRREPLSLPSSNCMQDLVSLQTAALPERSSMKIQTLGLQQPEQRDIGTQLSPPMPIAQIARWGDLFGGAGSDSGESVTPITAMQTATVNACGTRYHRRVARQPTLISKRSFVT